MGCLSVCQRDRRASGIIVGKVGSRGCEGSWRGDAGGTVGVEGTEKSVLKGEWKVEQDLST